MKKFFLTISIIIHSNSLNYSILLAQYPKVAEGKKIMISAHPLAAKAGLEIYKKGGNVVDVAVATAYALGVVEPHGSGIGGEGMMLIYNSKENKYIIIDFKAISPASANYHNLDFKNISRWNRTIKGASIPGAVAGLELAREKFGKSDRKTVLQPAIDYAIKGFEVDSTLSLNLESYKNTLEKDEYSRSIYYLNGKAPKVGDIIKNIDYGKTLKEILENGPDVFYKGKIANLISKDAEKNGGFIKKQDMEVYKPIIREPLKGNYRGYDIITSPPPCGGMHLIETLNILKYFDLKECKNRDNYSLHLLSEIFKLMFKDEFTYNGDPEFNKIDYSYITSDEFAFQRFLSINLSQSKHPSQVKPGNDTRNTTHLCVMDNEGNAVSLTITLSSLFGTAHTVEGTGFILNNEMQNFNPDDNHLNSLKPQKRVVTSLVPTIIAKKGKPIFVIGTPGGDLIISTIAQLIVNLVDYKMNLKEAVYSPRIFSTYYQREFEVEDRFSPINYKQLESFGHDIKLNPGFKAYFGAVQSIMLDWDQNILIGVSDPRRSGAAIGE